MIGQKRVRPGGRVARRRTWWMAAVVAPMAGVLLAACSSGGSNGSTTGAGGSNSSSSSGGSADSLTIAVPLANLGQGWPYIAQAEGYFKKVGLNATVLANAGVNNVDPMVLSGKADVALFGVNSPISAVAQGNSMQVIYGYSIDGIGGDLAVKSSSSVTSVQQLSGQRVGTIGASGSAYGDTALLSRYVVNHGGKPFQIIPYATPAALLAAIQSGQVAAAVGSPFYFDAAVAAKQVKLVIDMADSANREKYLGAAALPVNVVYGLKATLASKKQAVEKFLEALNMANEFMQKSTPSAIASAVQPLPSFKGVTAATNLEDAKIVKSFLYDSSQPISAATWQQVLQTVDLWKVDGFNSSDSKFSYGSMVDMSYLKGANGG